jgi:hypothetical protein
MFLRFPAGLRILKGVKYPGYAAFLKACRERVQKGKPDNKSAFARGPLKLKTAGHYIAAENGHRKPSTDILEAAARAADTDFEMSCITFPQRGSEPPKDEQRLLLLFRNLSAERRADALKAFALIFEKHSGRGK